jgi:hypothetical protein
MDLKSHPGGSPLINKEEYFSLGPVQVSPPKDSKQESTITLNKIEEQPSILVKSQTVIEPEDSENLEQRK